MATHTIPASRLVQLHVRLILEIRWPAIYTQLTDAFHLLEQHYKEMQDVEFSIEQGTLYMLQTRKAKRTAQAAMRIAVEMFKEGLMSKHEALMAVDPDQIDQLLHVQLDPKEKAKARVRKVDIGAFIEYSMDYFCIHCMF